MSIGFGLERLGFLTVRFPRIMATAVIAMIVICVSQLPKLNVDGDLLRVYADSGEHYDRYERLSQTFGTFEGDIYVLVNSPNLTDPAVLERVRELAFDLELNEFAVGTMTPFTLRKPAEDGRTVPAVPEGMTTPDQVSAALSDLQQNDPIMKNLIVPDLTGVVMIMFPNPELTRGDGEGQMIESLRALIAPYQADNLSVELTGPPIWTSEMLNASIDDQMTFTAYGFLIGVVIALLAFRNLWFAIIVALTPAVAVTWVMGMITLVFGSFSFLTIILTTLVLVITFAESLFFCFAWINNWRDGMDPYKAVDETVRVMGPASALTMLTTLVSFASLGLAPGQGIREFSMAGTLASLLLFTSLMTFLPLLLKTALRLGLKMPKPVSIALTAPLPWSWALANRFGRPVALLAVAATILLLIPYALIKPHFSFEDFVPKGSNALEAADQIDSGVGGVAPIYISIPLKEAVADVSDSDFATIERVHNILEGHLGPGKVISAASFRHYSDSGFTRDQIFDAVGPFMKRRFITDDGTQALVTGFLPTIVESDYLEDLVLDLDQELAAAGVEGADVGGFRVLTTFATDSIVRNLQMDLTLSVALNLFLIGFAFRSWRVAVASIIPNLFPILGTEAWLYFSGQGLQMTTVLALTIAFGIAVDDTIHFLSHYAHSRREEGYGHHDAVKRTLFRLGSAIVATTLVLCSGTFIVAFSELPQVALFGTLFVTTLGLALIGDLFILPSLLVAGGRFFHPLGGAPVEAGPPEETEAMTEGHSGREPAGALPAAGSKA